MFDRFRRVPDSSLKAVVLGLGFILIAARFVPLYSKPRGDFDLHYGLAMRLVAGQFIYGPGFDRVYPPFWAFVHAPFTFFDMHRVMILLFPFGVAGMVALVLLLKKLADRYWPLSPDLVFWSSTLAILLAAPFLHRDLVELGVNTFLVLLTWFGIYLWTARPRHLRRRADRDGRSAQMHPNRFHRLFLLEAAMENRAVRHGRDAFFHLPPSHRHGRPQLRPHGGLLAERRLAGRQRSRSIAHRSGSRPCRQSFPSNRAGAISHAPSLRASGPSGNSGRFPYPEPTPRTALLRCDNPSSRDGRPGGQS